MSNSNRRLRIPKQLFSRNGLRDYNVRRVNGLKGQKSSSKVSVYTKRTYNVMLEQISRNSEDGKRTAEQKRFTRSREPLSMTSPRQVSRKRSSMIKHRKQLRMLNRLWRVFMILNTNLPVGLSVIRKQLRKLFLRELHLMRKKRGQQSSKKQMKMISINLYIKLLQWIKGLIRIKTDTKKQ